jgi:hypothetical protein
MTACERVDLKRSDVPRKGEASRATRAVVPNSHARVCEHSAMKSSTTKISKLLTFPAQTIIVPLFIAMR